MSIRFFKMSTGLTVISVVIAVLGGILLLTGSISRPASIFAGAAVVIVLAIAARRRGR